MSLTKHFGLFRKMFSLTFVAFLLILINLFVPLSKKQDDVEAITDLTGDPTVTMASVKGTTSVAINPSIVGTFGTTSGADDISFTVSTTNYTGYELSARGATTTADSTNGSLQALTSGVTAAQFAAAANTTLNDRWGYKPSYYANESNDKYYGLTTTSALLNRTATANSSADTYTISLGARVSMGVSADSYVNNSLVLEAVANFVPSSNLTINYGDGVNSVTVGGQTIADGEQVKLIIGVPYTIVMTSDSDYGTANWSSTTGTVAASNQKTTTYTISNTNATLNADAIFTGPELQNMASSTCTTTPKRAKDNRDDQIYWVQRLDDGQCWIMNNLNLGATTLTTDLTTANTNIRETVTAATFNGWKTTSGTIEYEDGEFIPVTGTDATSNTAYGTLYNYYAASAGTISGAPNDYAAIYDICPAGWRLPIINRPASEFDDLNTLYGANMTAPFTSGGAAFALAGYFSSGAPTDQGSVGRYWSSISYMSNQAFDMRIQNGNVYVQSADARWYGNSIRCIMREASANDLIINYNANGYYFGSNSSNTVNTVKYKASALAVSDTKVSHTPNIDDSGENNDVMYDNNLNLNEVITIPGASSIHVELTYQTESISWDWVSMWAGKHPDYTAADDYGKGIIISATGGSGGKYGGTTKTTISTDIAGDSVTFGFRSDSSVNNYGYYAVVTGVGYDCEKIPTENMYAEPTMPAGYYFSGWSESPTGASTIYANEREIEYYYVATNGQTKTLYAIIDNQYDVTLKTSTGISQITVSKNGTTICTATTTAGTNCRLANGETYNIVATVNNGYSFNTWNNSNAIGIIGGSQSTTYTMGAGRTTLTAYATANYYTITVTFGTGVDSVTINNTTITTSGSTVSLRYGYTYSLAATASSGYYFISWTYDYGYINDQFKESTTYWVSANNATITANVLPVVDIQNMSDSDCYTAYERPARDTRDGQIYMVKKLNDGNCWMVTNLNLGANTLSTDLTSSNSNLSTTVTAATFNGWKTTSAVGTDSAGEYISVSGTDASSTTPYGTLYNFYAVSGGTTYGNTTDNAKYDICPAGWHLPTGGQDSIFYELITNPRYDTYNELRYATRDGNAGFAAAGSFYSGAPTYTGTNARYWGSNSANFGGYMYTLDITPSSVSTLSLTPKGYGMSVRCVKKSSKTISNITYLQDLFNGTINANERKSIINKLLPSTQYLLYDNRDNKAYHVAVLNDRLWMVENLDLGRTNLSVNLTSANTNVEDTIPYTTFNSWRKTTSSSTYDGGEFISVSGTDLNSGTAYGTLYNYYAASGGTISGSSNLDSAEHDICPSGFKLPTAQTYGTAYDFNSLLANPNFDTYAEIVAPIVSGGAAFTLSGYFGQSGAASQNVNGTFWSTDMYNYTYATGLVLVKNWYEDNLPRAQISYANRGDGHSIRCIMRNF